MDERGRRPRVGMALYSEVTYDSRVRREARTLACAGYDVSIVCLGGEGRSPDLPENVTVLVRRPTATSILPGISNPFHGGARGRVASLARRAGWLRAYVGNLRSWGRLAVAACGPVDAWHAHDLPGLAALLPNVDRNVPVVYDSHELFLEAGTALMLPSPARTLLRAYERRLVSRVSAVVTVNNALADVLRRRYRPRRIEVVHNCPDRWSPPADRPRHIRNAAAIADDAPVILYHGGLGGNRGIEQLMEALLRPGLERTHLAVMGSGDGRDHYTTAAAEARFGGRVHVLDPVPPAELLPWVASADVGGVLIQRSTLNHYLSTPNKLFECLAAGIPVVASDFPMMRRIVAANPGGPLGAVCDPSSVGDVAAALRSVLELDPREAQSLRARSLDAAHERWNWETESASLTGLYADLIDRPS
jgi:glycosyltransferase involved in cell wall biosynthesis